MRAAQNLGRFRSDSFSRSGPQATGPATKSDARHDNPCLGVSLPKSQLTQEMTVLTRDEFAQLLSKVAPFCQPLVLRLVATGLRFGEAAALTASEVEVSTNPATIRETKAWKRDEDSRYYVGPPKTRRARRTISLPDELVDVLLPLLATKAPDELLFTNTVGQWLSSSRFWTSTWAPALDAASDPRKPDGTPDPDAPRQTKGPGCTACVIHTPRGCSPRARMFVLQRRLGHESITRTTETYPHLMPDQQKAADAAAKALEGLVPKENSDSPAKPRPSCWTGATGFYNHDRGHSSADMMSPINYETTTADQTAA